jgi:phosphoglycerate dehydrogenase-like enzyme
LESIHSVTKTIAILPAMARPLLEPRLPDWLAPRWFMTLEEALAMAQGAEIGWMDMADKTEMAQAIAAATELKWLSSLYSGLDGMPLDQLKAQGTIVTNGTGINAITIAEYVIMGMLIVAKGYRDVVRAADRHEWLWDSPGKVELFGSKALLIGYGAIGQLVEERLKAFAVDVTVVRRTPSAHAIGPQDWQARLGEFDWVILAVPATAETECMIGADELAAMKSSATLINIARGTVVDQEALITALTTKSIAAAFLDVTDPDPLPAGHPLWDVENAHISMHLSGRAQTQMFQRSAARFFANLDHYHKGEPMEYQINLDRGY